MPGKKILIVDDEAVFTMMLKMNLEDCPDYEVKVENRGLHAVATAREFMPDIIFLDMVMPDIDGEQLLERLRAQETLKNVPVVFITALVTRGEDSLSGRKISGCECLAKPVTTEQIIDCINKHSAA